MNHALDACAMLAYLRGEAGGDVVAALLTEPTAACFAHTVNIIEVDYDFLRDADARTAQSALLALRADGVAERRDLSRDFARRVRRLKARGRISLADCFCIALAQEISGEVVTSDRHEFAPLVPLNLCPIRFIR